MQPTEAYVDYWNAVKKPSCWQKLHLETSGTQFTKDGFMQPCEENKFSMSLSWFGVLAVLKTPSLTPQYHL